MSGGNNVRVPLADTTDWTNITTNRRTESQAVVIAIKNGSHIHHVSSALLLQQLM